MTVLGRRSRLIRSLTAVNGGKRTKSRMAGHTQGCLSIHGTAVLLSRHTCVSLLIAQGAHAKEIQIRLGNASITTTMKCVRARHLQPSLDE